MRGTRLYTQNILFLKIRLGRLQGPFPHKDLECWAPFANLRFRLRGPLRPPKIGTVKAWGMIRYIAGYQLYLIGCHTSPLSLPISLSLHLSPYISLLIHFYVSYALCSISLSLFSISPYLSSNISLPISLLQYLSFNISLHISLFQYLSSYISLHLYVFL